MIPIKELSEIALFEDFSEADLTILASIASYSQWQEGETLFRLGSPAVRFYILRSGTVLLCFPNGRSLPLREKGLAIGWSSLMSPFYYTATALCLTNVTLYEFTGRELYRLLMMDADFGQRLMQKIGRIMERRKPYRSGPSLEEPAA